MKKKNLLIGLLCAAAIVLLVIITVKDLQGDYHAPTPVTNMTRPTWPSELEDMVQAHRPSNPNQNNPSEPMASLQETQQEPTSWEEQEETESATQSTVGVETEPSESVSSTEPVPTEPSETEPLSETNPTVLEPSQSSDPVTQPAEEETTEPITEPTEPEPETSEPATEPTESDPENSEPETVPAETEEEELPTQEQEAEPLPFIPETQPVEITFPYVIPETSLEIKVLESYSGTFLEDGSDESVENMATVILSNNGQDYVEYADVMLTAEDGTELHFVVSGMDPGSMAVVMESGCATYEDREYVNCAAQIAYTDGFSMSQDLVTVKEDSDGSLLVTNISTEDIPVVRVFYKFYMESANAYVGGITYTAKIEDLKAGESRNVMPSHYAAGYSKVIMVRTYEANE